MADTNINTGVPIRFEADGQLDITDGATTYDVKQIAQGTVEFEPGGYASISYKDRGVLQDDLEGDEIPSRIRFSIQLTSFQAAQLYAILTARDTSTGKKKKFTIAVKYAAYKGATTGQTVTFADCVLDTQVRIRAGAELDTMEWDMKSNDPFPAIGTY